MKRKSAWELPETSDEEPIPGEDRDRRLMPDSGGQGDAQQLPSDPLPLPPPAGQEPFPNGVEDGAPADGNAGPAHAILPAERAARGSSFPRWSTPWGDLVYWEQKQSMAAHCECKGHDNCRLNAVLSKKPLGLLLAWLSHGVRHTETIKCRGNHMKIRATLGPEQGLAARRAARAWLQDQEGPAWDWLRSLEGEHVEEPLRIT